MPDLIVSFLRQRPPRLEGSIGDRGRWAIVLLAATLAVACNRAQPAEPVEEPALTDGSSDQTDQPRAENSSSGEPMASAPSEPDETGAVPGAWFDGRLPALTSPSNATELELLQLGDTHSLLVRVESSRNSSTITTWMLPNGVPDAPIAANDRVSIHHRRSPAVGPRIIETARGGALVIRATDSITNEGGGASLITQRIGADGNVDELATPLVVPGWTLRSAWAAARLGDDVLLCFLGAPGGAAETAPDDQLACGTIASDGEAWTRAPVSVALADPGTSIEAPALAGGEGHALLTYFDPQALRVQGRFVRFEDGLLSLSEATDLSGDDASGEEPFGYRREPMGLVVDGGALFALPVHNGVPARAGFLGLDGAVRGGLSTITGLGSIFERPRFVEGDNGFGLLFDATGRRGERSLLAFAEEGAMMIDMVGLFGAEGGQRARARLGPSSGSMMSFVWTPDEGPPRFTIIENDRW